MITKEQAMTAQVFHDRDCKIWRRNGATKTWKTRPEAFRVPVKYGLYSYDGITETTGDLVHTADDCPHKK